MPVVPTGGVGLLETGCLKLAPGLRPFEAQTVHWTVCPRERGIASHPCKAFTPISSSACALIASAAAWAPAAVVKYGILS